MRSEQRSLLSADFRVRYSAKTTVFYTHTVLITVLFGKSFFFFFRTFWACSKTKSLRSDSNNHDRLGCEWPATKSPSDYLTLPSQLAGRTGSACVGRFELQINLGETDEVLSPFWRLQQVAQHFSSHILFCSGVDSQHSGKKSSNQYCIMRECDLLVWSMNSGRWLNVRWQYLSQS